MQGSIIVISDKLVKVCVEKFITRNNPPAIKIWYIAADNEVWFAARNSRYDKISEHALPPRIAFQRNAVFNLHQFVLRFNEHVQN